MLFLYTFNDEHYILRRRIFGVSLLPTIIAHRGASDIAPENTLPAFRLAEQLGAESIETDVHLTKDDIPVLIHDARLERTTNGQGYVKDYTFAELKQLDAGAWFANQYKATQLMSLAQFLQWIKPKQLTINLELKNNEIHYKYLEEIVYEHIEQFNMEHRITISTFNPDSIQHMASFNKEVPLALLRSRRKQHLWTYAVELGANSLHINYRLLNKHLLQQCERHQLAVRVYTVNKFRQMMHCFNLQCHGIFTDVPGKALYHRKSFLLNNSF